MTVKKPANTESTGRRKANKTTWQKGMASPNPKGRPSAGMSWGELIKAEGEKYNEKSGMTRKEWLVMRAYDLAGAGNGAIFRELMQRSEPQADELKVSGGYALNIIQIGKEPTSAPDADKLSAE